MCCRKIAIKELVIVTLTLSLLGYVVGERLDLFSKSTIASSDNAFAATQELPSFVALANKLSPAVVNISTNQTVEAPRLLREPFSSPFGKGDPFFEFWERFFGHQFPHQGSFRQRSLGSGFVIDADGYILTNNHVIMNAEEITVKLSDGRKFEAKVIGKDPKTDIAVIKIDADGSLTTVSLGNSDKLQVGEWILAIGNPFGLDRTVTAGIVSAKGRIIGAGPYDDFIQTDASINPGNSGGPLINLQGEVVGVNTAIFSRSGGNIGIGFAIPINLVKDLLPELKSKGKVVRGWLGVAIQKVTPALAESLGLERPRGALVASVGADSPADRAGMQAGDVIIAFDEKNIEDSDDLPLVVARTPVGKRVQVKVIRDQEQMSLSVSVGELKEKEAIASAEERKNFGLTVQNVTPQVAESLGLDRAEGVVVSSVAPRSVADEAGLRRGDVILEIDRKRIKNLSDFQKATSNIKKDQVVLVLVDRGARTRFLTLRAPG
ncbi:MAG TPA: DegQ family serine endoprotease [Candidatus Binatia bacterium]|jgi:serine protease Do|nr:DegQ family serine endoprotease [Candidatus Binatia bacterium]